MKRLVRNILIVSAIYILAAFFTNYFIDREHVNDDSAGRLYVNRIFNELKLFEEEYGRAAASIAELQEFTGETYSNIICIYSAYAKENGTDAISLLNGYEGSNYKILSTENYCYRIDFSVKSKLSFGFIFVINAALFVMYVVAVAILCITYVRIIKPYNRVSNLPFELSKGNLTIPLEEQKNKQFGRFLWGLDLLREKLEENKKNELALQREKKVLLMSLSHDIKTPLSAIKLYSSALKKDLYKEEAKRKEIAGNIGLKADEIENYVSDIIKSSSRDFLKFEVNIGEYYTKDIVDEIENYYDEKLKLLMIDFEVSPYTNLLLSCDKDRVIEVLQNLIENAIKYGDGKKISLEILKEDKEMHFAVTNTGSKLKKRELPHVFDSFFRGSNVEKKQGSGLGLYICRELVRLMHGEIYAEIIDEDKMRVEFSIRMV